MANHNFNTSIPNQPDTLEAIKQYLKDNGSIPYARYYKTDTPMDAYDDGEVNFVWQTSEDIEDIPSNAVVFVQYLNDDDEDNVHDIVYISGDFQEMVDLASESAHASIGWVAAEIVTEGILETLTDAVYSDIEVFSDLMAVYDEEEDD